MVNKSGDVTIGYDYKICSFEDGNTFIIVPIEYEKYS